MKEYQIFRCPNCRCEYFDKNAPKRKGVGDPMAVCPECGQKSLRPNIFEPALIGESRYFDIKFSSIYGNMRVGIILIYAVFLFIVLIKRELYTSLYLLGAAAIVYAVYGLIRAIHMYIFLKSDEYSDEISRSMARLSNPEYAKMIGRVQSADKNSVYYYELSQKNNGK